MRTIVTLPVAPQLSFVSLDPENFEAWADEMLRGEEEYPLAIRSTREDFQEMIGCVAFVALLDDEYVGNAVGDVPFEEDWEEFGVTSTHDVYLFNLTLLKAQQGKGYGKAILAEFLRRAREAGFTRVIGHFRDGNSLFIARKAGFTELREYLDWEGTGERYVLCALNL